MPIPQKQASILQPYRPGIPSPRPPVQDSVWERIWRVCYAILRWTFRLSMLLLLPIASALGGGAWALKMNFEKLPDVTTLSSYSPIETTEIYDDQNKLMFTLHEEENRRFLPIREIPKVLKEAVLAAEDSRFYEHQGVDFIGIARALQVNWQKGAAVQGGSTITQQITKNLFLVPERTIKRKLAEAYLSYQIEKRFSKEQILEVYLNQIYWGHNAYGIEAAALLYFNKHAKDLGLHEAAMLAGILTGPEIYSPYRSMERAKTRQKLTLQRMLEHHLINTAQAQAAEKQPIKLAGIKVRQMKYPYFTSYVLAVLKQKYGDSELLSKGLKVYTTINTQWQTEAEKYLQEHVQRLKGYRVSQAALVAVEPHTGFVRAMVGGKNYQESQFNRAWQAQRQPGSAFKPFVYLTAFARGFDPAHTEVDEPIQYRFGSYLWKPHNYSGGYSGRMTLQRALETSSNIIAVKLGEKVGNSNVIETAYRLGIRSPLRGVLSLPLGASEVTPLEMATAYATIANGGTYFEPTPISRIEDRYGNIVEDNRQRLGERVISSGPTQTLIKVMKGVITRGTAPAARLGRPVAGKTGTTSKYRDAWFVGFTPQLSTAVWIGNDTLIRMGGSATGGTLAAPLWARFMRYAHQKLPILDFKGAEGYMPVLAGIKDENQAEEEPLYERLNGQDQPKNNQNSELDPGDLPVPLDELVPIAQSGTGRNPSQAGRGPDFDNTHSLTLPQANDGSGRSRGTNSQSQSSSAVSESTNTSQTPGTEKSRRNELEQLMNELEQMSNTTAGQ